MEQMFKVVKAKMNDGKEIIATAVVSDHPRNYTKLASTLRLQRIQLLEKGNEASKKEAEKLAALNVEMEKGNVEFFISKQEIDRLRYVAIYKQMEDGKLDLDKELEWEEF